MIRQDEEVGGVVAGGFSREIVPFSLGIVIRGEFIVGRLLARLVLTVA
jgi:hypothetical protein